MSHMIKDRHGTYYARRVIPPALRPFMPDPWQGKAEWRRTLGTKDPKAAKRAHIAMLARMDADFSVAETRQRAANRESLTDEEIATLSEWFWREALHQDDQFREVEHREDEDLFAEVREQVVAAGGDVGPAGVHSGWGLSDRQMSARKETLEGVQAALGDALGRGDTRLVDADAADLLAVFGLRLPEDSPSRRRFELSILRASMEVVKEKLARLSGEGSPAPEPWTPAADGTVMPKGSPSVTSGEDRGPLLSEALEHWREGGGARGTKKPAPRVVMDAEHGVRRFIELHGDHPLGNITKKMVREFRTALSGMATRLPTELRALPLPELVKRDLSKFPRISAATVNKTLTLLGAVVAHAERDGYLEEVQGFVSPFRNMLLTLEEDDDNRLPFEDADLASIFGAPVFTEDQRPEGGAGEAAFWFPVLGLLMGGRLQEIADLRVCDVRQSDDGLWHFDINDEDGRRLKTKSSRRKVPMHPTLVEIGFLDYLASRKDAGPKVSLWPALAGEPGESVHSAPWSKWFGRYLRGTISIAETRKVFHSFRHTFKRLTRDAGITEEMHDALSGHGEIKGAVGRRYGRGFSLSVLAAAMGSVKAPKAVAGLRWGGVSPS